MLGNGLRLYNTLILDDGSRVSARELVTILFVVRFDRCVWNTVDLEPVTTGDEISYRQIQGRHSIEGIEGNTLI